MQMESFETLFLAYDNEAHLLCGQHQLINKDQLHGLQCQFLLGALLKDERLGDDHFLMDCHKCGRVLL